MVKSNLHSILRQALQRFTQTIMTRVIKGLWCHERCRTVASLTVPGGQDFHFPYSFPKFQLHFLIFFSFSSSFWPSAPTRKGPGYATGTLTGKRCTYDINQSPRTLIGTASVSCVKITSYLQRLLVIFLSPLVPSTPVYQLRKHQMLLINLMT